VSVTAATATRRGLISGVSPARLPDTADPLAPSRHVDRPGSRSPADVGVVLEVVAQPPTQGAQADGVDGGEDDPDDEDRETESRQ